AFAATDERVLNVGGALISEVVLDLLKIAPDEYRDIVRKSGVIGEALAKLWEKCFEAIGSPAAPPREPFRAMPRSGSPGLPLTLADLSKAFEQLAANGTRDSRRHVLHELFERCTHPRQAAYVGKIISGDLRTGVQEGVLDDAIAKAFE